MGLSIVCSCGEICFAAGSYSGFHLWRTMLAKRLGFDLEEYWMRDGQPKTDFEPLLMHSDCDGYLTPKECKRMIRPMEELIRKCEEELENPWTRILMSQEQLDDLKWFLSKCYLWLQAFRHSAKEKCRLMFT
ncbi:MAG: hypothetical protein OH337_04080 [Candidatus Parvarchaeota archaeon]|nr:hypothetical protein [Candidatus Haiyanarchaeum thermophilum]